LLIELKQIERKSKSKAEMKTLSSPNMLQIKKNKNKAVSHIALISSLNNMRQVQPETLSKNSNFSSCLQNIKLENNTT
jgi:hypothetical protein